MNNTDEKSNSWNIKPMPQKFATLDYVANFSQNEFELISKGFTPIEMEDKWVIVFNNNILSFYRSWSGYCIFQVKFTYEKNTYKIINTIVNRDPDEYKQSNKSHDEALINYLIKRILLKDTSISIPIQRKPWWKILRFWE